MVEVTAQRAEVAGIGSPIVDLLAKVEDGFLSAAGGAKGGMELVDSATLDKLLQKLPQSPVMAAGGSAGNTIYAMARLGRACSFLGKLGQDSEGDYYRCVMAEQGVGEGLYRYDAKTPSARCLSLVTPDNERTMRTCLGAAALLAPEEISAGDFSGIRLVHIEGYLLFNPALAEKALRSAHEAGCKVSLDLGSFEVVRAAGANLGSLLEKYVDYVFANEDEGKAFCGSDDPMDAVRALGKLCPVVAVKLGARGAWLQREGSEPVRVEAVMAANPIDATGAGDFWAAGFLHGELSGCDLATSGRMGAVLGCEVVQQLGADLPEEIWAKVKQDLGKIRP